MASFDFPASPTLNQVYTPAGGPSYVWDGVAWRSQGGGAFVAKAGDTMTGSLLVAPAAGNAEVMVKTAGSETTASFSQTSAGDAFIWNNSFTWHFQKDGYFSCGPIWANGNITTVGSITVGQGANASYIRMFDGDNGSRAVHNNSGWIGFLSSSDGWVLHVDDSGALWTGQTGAISDYVWSVANERANAWANTRVEGMRWTGGGDYGWGNNAWGAGNSGNVITGVHWAAVGSALVDAIRVRYLQYYRTDTGYVTVGDG